MIGPGLWPFGWRAGVTSPCTATVQIGDRKKKKATVSITVTLFLTL
jgi:hypothetical protein